MTKGDSSELWYKDGLKFSCSGCGDCCTGAPGFVWVDQSETQAIADSLGIPREDFEDQYTRKIGLRRSLKEFSNGDCVFFDNETRKCEVYGSRPRQCKTWPFWDSNLRTPEDWERTCEECPGSGTGKLHQLVEIEDRRKSVKI
ncbi:MAG: YkgJ family cysteine cluster protein [Mariniblastus sp.]